MYEKILIGARTNDAEMSSEEQNNIENRNKRIRKSKEDKEIVASDLD